MQSWGTEGDIRPFLILGSALARRGHEVRLVYTNVEGRDLRPPASPGLEVIDVGGEYFHERRAQIAAHATENFRIKNPIAQLDRILEETLDPVAERMFEAGRALSAWAQLNVLHFLAHPAMSAADAEHRPFVALAFAPVFPTRFRPPMGAPNLGRWLNPLLWWIASRALGSILTKRVNGLRARAGLAQVSDVTNAVFARARLSLLAVSPALMSRPADWPASMQLCGFLADEVAPTNRGAANGSELDSALTAFLEAGPPPLFFTFGSMANLDEPHAERSARIAIEAASRLRSRLIVQVPATLRERLSGTAGVHVVSRASHTELFPRCALVIHHGGAGTTQTVLRAGRPAIVIPHVADQPFWGELVWRRGVAAKPLPVGKLTAQSLETRIRGLLADTALDARCRALQTAVARESGAEVAVAAIERAAGNELAQARFAT